MASDLSPFIRRTAQNLGISPSDLGTAISYETGGKLDPNMWGGKGGKHLGLIQFGPEEQQKYGVTPNMPIDQHFGAIENYLRDRGLKPGMGMLDLYSTINAGRPGLSDRSDTANGGMPGTVADKVATQMVGHRARANSLLGDETGPSPIVPPGAPQPQATVPAPGEPMNIAPPAAASAPGQGGVPDPTALLKAFGSLDGGRGQQPEQVEPPPPINIAQPAGLPAARQLAQIMQSLGRAG